MKLQGISSEGLQRIASVKPGMPKGWQSGKTAQYDDEFEEEAAPKFDYSPKDSKAYWDAVEAFAQDIKEEAQETGQDVNELVHSWVDGSEYSFKPRMEKIVLAESPNANGSAFEAMVADIMQEMGKSASKRGQMLPEDPSLFEDEDEEIEDDEEEEEDEDDSTQFESMNADDLLDYIRERMDDTQLVDELHQAMGSNEAKPNYLHIIQMWDM